MTAFDLYHHYFGDQGKAIVEIIRWGAITVQMHKTDRRVAEHKRQLRSHARINLVRKVPELRLHISGERYYVH